MRGVKELRSLLRALLVVIKEAVYFGSLPGQ